MQGSVRTRLQGTILAVSMGLMCYLPLALHDAKFCPGVGASNQLWGV